MFWYEQMTLCETYSSRLIFKNEQQLLRQNITCTRWKWIENYKFAATTKFVGSQDVPNTNTNYIHR